MAYIPEDSAEILAELDIKSTEELFNHIPKEVRRTDDISSPASSEKDIINEAKALAANNFTGIDFNGYGLYSHEIPAAVNHISSNRNFVTSYTPYQPEVAQGTLQAIFEYQSLMSSLTSMNIVNASMYDAATSMVEAIRMDIRTNKSDKKKVLLSEGIHPYILDVLQTYFPETVKHDLNVEFEIIPVDKKTGSIKWEDKNLKEARAVVVLNPTKWGTLEKDLPKIKQINPDITLIYGTLEVLSLTVLPAPADFGADMVWGDAQSLGIPVSFGGPSLGFLAAQEKYVRQMPGRLIGKTEAKNREGDTVDSYVITLSTREQHIRREKATSNICSNQSLMAVRAAAYMAFMGWSGMQKICVDSMKHREYFQNKLKEKQISLLFPEGDYFHEVAWISENADSMMQKGFEKNIAAGKKENDSVIISYFSDLLTTEKIDQLLSLL